MTLSSYDIPRLRVTQHAYLPDAYAICTDYVYVHSVMGTVGTMAAQGILLFLTLVLLVVNVVLWRRYTQYRKQHAALLKATVLFRSHTDAQSINA